MPVSSTNKAYDSALPKWCMVEDCVSGSSAIKSGKTKYLPKPNPEDTTIENSNRYDSYRERANFVNFTGFTKEGFMGMAFRSEPQAELPLGIEYLIDNANGAGLSLNQLTRSCVAETMVKGRYGLLCDYPFVRSKATKAEVDKIGARASIKRFDAKSVINWATTVVDGVEKLSLVVIKETVNVSKDEFSSEDVDQYRVLRLTNGVYTQQVYNQDEKPIDEPIEIKKGDGTRWTEIPFVFIGTEDNDTDVDKALLYDIAEINIAHYRNSADYEESSFMVGQPTPVFAGLSQAWVDENMNGAVLLGSRTAIPLPEGGSATLLQASENQMPRQGMLDKEQQMVMIGARLIDDNRGGETAYAANLRFVGQNSKLGLLISNTESAIKSCLKWCAEFMNESPEEIEFSMNRELYEPGADPQMIIAQIQLMDRGVIAKNDLRASLRNNNIINADRTDEDIDQEAESTVFGGEFGV